MNQTPHRKAASNPEVAALLKKLKRTWELASYPSGQAHLFPQLIAC